MSEKDRGYAITDAMRHSAGEDVQSRPAPEGGTPWGPPVTGVMVRALQDALTMTISPKTLTATSPNFRPSDDLARRALIAALSARPDAPPSPGGHGIAQPENGDHPPYLPDDTDEPYGEDLVQLRDFLARGPRPDELPAFLAGLGFSGEREPGDPTREYLLEQLGRVGIFPPEGKDEPWVVTTSEPEPCEDGEELEDAIRQTARILTAEPDEANAEIYALATDPEACNWFALSEAELERISREAHGPVGVMTVGLWTYGYVEGSMHEKTAPKTCIGHTTVADLRALQRLRRLLRAAVPLPGVTGEPTRAEDTHA